LGRSSSCDWPERRTSIFLAGRGIGIILNAGFRIRAKKEAGCRIFAYERVCRPVSSSGRASDYSAGRLTLTLIPWMLI